MIRSDTREDQMTHEDTLSSLDDDFSNCVRIGSSKSRKYSLGQADSCTLLLRRNGFKGAVQSDLSSNGRNQRWIGGMIIVVNAT